MTVNLRLDISYDGTCFHGWATQSGLRTVQQSIEDALRLVLRLGTSYTLTVAGRTDAGVHAPGQVANIVVPRASLEQRSLHGEAGTLTRRLNKLLDEDIQITRVSEVSPDFDARFSALRRHYEYRVSTSPIGPSPLRRLDTAWWKKPVDIALLQAAGELFVGLHDFAAVCKHKPHATTIRSLEEFSWEDISTPREPDTYLARVTADAFCWSMVRSLVGACLAVGEGRKEPYFPQQLLTMRERSPEVQVAPACGLTLVGVTYPAESEFAERADATRRMRSSAT